MARWIAVALGIGSLCLIPSTEAQSAARAPVCGATIAGVVTLTADLICPSGHGLVLGGGTTLDCAGHRIAGGNQVGQYGIYVRDGLGAVVKNCVVQGFEVGIRLRGATSATVTTSVAQANLRYGIEVTQNATGARITHSRISSNGDKGIHVSGPAATDAGHSIVENTIAGNGAEGIYVLQSSANLIAGNTIRDHGAAGIYVKGSARNAID